MTTKSHSTPDLSDRSAQSIPDTTKQGGHASPNSQDSQQLDASSPKPRTLTVTRWTDWSVAAPLVPAWQSLCRLDSHATVFASHGFVRALWRSFGDDAPLELLAVCDGDDTIGLVPFTQRTMRRAGLAYREVGFYRNHHTLRNSVLAAPGKHGLVLSAILEAMARTAGWHVMFLENIPSQSPIATELGPAASRQGLRNDPVEPGRRLCFAAINGTWAEYRAAMSRNQRWQLKKSQRRAHELGRVEYRCLSTRAEIADALPEVFLLQAKSWQEIERTDPTVTAADHAFEYALLDDLDDDEIGDLWLMTIDGRLVASLRMLGAPRKRYVHTMHYDPAAKEVSPGSLLFEKMLEAAWAAGLMEVDFHGDGAFFRRWTSQHREHVTTRVYSASMLGMLLQSGRRLRHQWRAAMARNAD